MATAVFPKSDASINLGASLDDRHGWGFGLLLALVATLFVRPADLVPALDDWPIYQFLIVCCLVVSLRAVFKQLIQQQLILEPVTACVLVLLVAVGASHLSHGNVWGARMSMFDFAKLLTLYLLIVGLINSPERLFLFARWLTIAISVVASLSLLDRFDYVSIAALESVRDHANEAGREVAIERIRGTGIFQDPNDFGLILVTGLTLCVSFLLKPRVGWRRYGWLIPAGALLGALALTHSRGALLSLVCAFAAALVYFRAGRLGMLTLPALPLLALAFSGRMTDISAVNDGTGQSRIQIWSDSLAIWREYPIFGLGQGLLIEELGVVAHNSFLHCFAELGFLGGTAFLACFLAAGLNLWMFRDRRSAVTQADQASIHDQASVDVEQLAHLRGFIFVALAGAAAGMLTISRHFVAPTYLILGLAASAQRLSSAETARWQFGNRFLAATLVASLLSLMAFYLAVRIFVRW
jgi:O-antigen ligase